MRIGFASDIHRLVYGRKLMLAGVDVPHYMGELAHSDGDVVYHAVAESILGALAIGDLGTHFPDNDKNTEGMDSAIIMRYVYDKMKEMGYEINNIDVSIYLEEPKLKSYKETMRRNIANLLHTDIANVSVKAGTNESLDAVGQRLAVKSDSIVLLQEIKK